MSDHLLTLLFLLVGAVSAQSEIHYYITPSPDIPCPEEPCLTLSQFAANSSNCTGNVSLIFFPGNHILDSMLNVSGADNFSMKPRDNKLVTIECKSQSGQFVVYETTFSSIKRLHFNGCGGNTVTKAKQLVVEDTTFQGVEEEGRGTALVLNEVNFAEITGSSFISNTPGVNSEHHYVREFITDPDILQRLALEEDDLISVGGALLTTSSNVSVTNTKFILNEAEMGGVLLAYKSIITISQCTCSYNRARVMSTLETPVNNTSSNVVDDGSKVNNSDFIDKRFGGVMFAVSGSLKIIDSNFTDNAAASGGVMFTLHGSVNITSSTFINNTAWTAVHTPVNERPSLFVDGIGGVIFTINGSFIITCSNFSNNSATYNGGVMVTSGGAFNINSCVFTTNIAVQWGGFMGTHGGSFNITNSMFTNTTARDGGIMITFNASLRIYNSTFTGNNVSREGGVMYTTKGGSFNITNSMFTNNTAGMNGGVMLTWGGSFHISTSTFTNNNAATSMGGVMLTWSGSFNVTNSTFTNNTAAWDGAVMYLSQAGSFYIKNSSFRNNTAESYRGIIFAVESSTHVTDSTFHYNSGSLYAFNGNLTFSGQSKFENGIEPSNKTIGEGGALTCFQSTIIFNGETSLMNNQARQGGAILAIESTILLYGTTTIANNTATNSSGGGVSLQQSNLEIKGSCNVFGNHAMRGGGIHAKSSTISVYQKGGTLQFISNNAKNGSGLYLEINPKLYLLKSEAEGANVRRNFLIFTDNHAHYGGAVYVADNTNFGACSPNIECFIQILAVYRYYNADAHNTVNIHFSGNSATEHGANMFGGLLDRCVPSSFAEVYRNKIYYGGVSYIQHLSNIQLDSIASPPVRVCFCNNESEPDCSYQPPPINVKKGEAFNVSLVAVDQVNHSVVANIISSLAHDSVFSEGQQTQTVGRNCTNLTFNVFSPFNSESINLFADGVLNFLYAFWTSNS